MKQLFVMGDSISVHYRPYLSQMLAGEYELAVSEYEKMIAETDLDHPQGMNSGDSYRVLEKLTGHIPVCDCMLLNCGLHDIKRDHQTDSHQFNIAQYEKNLREILNLLDGISVVWVRTTPVDDERHNARASFYRYNRDVEAYNNIADQVMRQAGIPMIDLYRFTLSLPGERYVDHVHYAEPVRMLQAAYIAGFLSRKELSR